jgi:hypothetical protein
VFADLCGDAIKAANFMGLPDVSRRDLLDGLRQEACSHSGFISVPEALSAIEQMNGGASVYDVVWGERGRQNG